MLRIVIQPAWLFVVSFFVILLCFPFSAWAQQSAGVGLSPTLIEMGADPGEVIEEQITISNLSDLEQHYFMFTRDISGVRDGGSPLFATEGTERTGYELTEWITIGILETVLAPGEEETIPITITVPDSATPGSHFGGIFVGVEPPRLRSSGAGVGYEVANIVSIRISGDVIENSQIRSFSTDKLIYGSTLVELTARLENKGNVLSRPHGPLEIFNMFGKKVVTMNFNESQGGVFPGTIRDFKITWEDDGLGFGRYQAVLGLVYGEKGVGQSTLSRTVSFWILPMNILKPALITLGILLLVAYISIRMYIKRSVAHVSGTQRRIVRRGRRSQGQSTLLLVAVVMLVVTALFLIILLALFA